MQRTRRIAGLGAITATVTLLALQPVAFGRGAPTVLLVVAGIWLFARGLSLAALALFAAADGDGRDWRLWLVPLQVVLGFGALYAAIWRLDPGSLIGAGLEPPLASFSVFAATFGAAGGIAPEAFVAKAVLVLQVVVVAVLAGALVRRLDRATGWVIGAIAVVLGAGLALTFGEERRLRSEFQRGITLTGYQTDVYASPEAAGALRAARDLGAEWVTVVPTWYQGKAFFHGVGPDSEKTPSDESVERIVELAGELGMSVTVKPHVDVLDGTYRGEIKPDDLDAWFESYRGMLSVYADIAERAGAEQFAVGTELEGVSGEAERWREVIEFVRGRFRGTLTYAANWDEVANVRFWDALDLIGVDAYFPLDGATEVGDLVEAWRGPVRRLERLHERYGKDVLLTEIGYPNVATATERPWEATGRRDTELQSRAVEAALTTWAEAPWAAGMAWWEWTSAPASLPPGTLGFALNGTPAADVIREWYSD